MNFADDQSAWLEVVACRTLTCNPRVLRKPTNVSQTPLKLLRQAGENHAGCIHRVNDSRMKCSARLHHGCSVVFSRRLEPTAPMMHTCPDGPIFKFHHKYIYCPSMFVWSYNNNIYYMSSHVFIILCMKIVLWGNSSWYIWVIRDRSLHRCTGGLELDTHRAHFLSEMWRRMSDS